MKPLLYDPDFQEEIEKFICMINSSHKPVQFTGLIGIGRLLSVDGRHFFPFISFIEHPHGNSSNLRSNRFWNSSQNLGNNDFRR